MNDESSRSHAIFQAIFTQESLFSSHDVCFPGVRILTCMMWQIEETTEGEGSEDESRKRSEKVVLRCSL
jgi:hypothetical protein